MYSKLISIPFTTHTLEGSLDVESQDLYFGPSLYQLHFDPFHTPLFGNDPNSQPLQKYSHVHDKWRVYLYTTWLQTTSYQSARPGTIWSKWTSFPSLQCLWDRIITNISHNRFRELFKKSYNKKISWLKHIYLKSELLSESGSPELWNGLKHPHLVAVKFK